MCTPIRNNCFSSTIYNVLLDWRLRLSTDIWKWFRTAARLGPGWLPRCHEGSLHHCRQGILDRQSATSIAQSANAGSVTMNGYANVSLS